MSDAIDIDPIERRQQEIKLRRAEIAATLAEWKRAYIVEGVSRPLRDRVTLEAEDANLHLEARQIGQAAVEAASVRRQRIAAGELAQLQSILRENGLDDLVIEARKRAEAAEAQLAKPGS